MRAGCGAGDGSRTHIISLEGTSERCTDSGREAQNPLYGRLLLSASADSFGLLPVATGTLGALGRLVRSDPQAEKGDFLRLRVAWAVRVRRAGSVGNGVHWVNSLNPLVAVLALESGPCGRRDRPLTVDAWPGPMDCPGRCRPFRCHQRDRRLPRPQRACPFRCHRRGSRHHRRRAARPCRFPRRSCRSLRAR